MINQLEMQDFNNYKGKQNLSGIDNLQSMAIKINDNQ